MDSSWLTATVDFVLVGWQAQGRYCLAVSDVLKEGEIRALVDDRGYFDWPWEPVLYEPDMKMVISATTLRRSQVDGGRDLLTIFFGEDYGECFRRMAESWAPPATPAGELSEALEGLPG